MRIIREIFHGGFGRVEKVETDSGEVVARKVFDPQLGILAATNRDKLRRRFRREVMVQSSLKGHAFLPILKYDLDCGSPWFIMPLAKRNFGKEIATAREEGRSLTDEIADILNAIEELHSCGFTHRDLKPQNILLHEEIWKLSDFGLVLPVVSATTTLTSTGSAWGSVLYCAPEQALDFKHATQQVDIYSFGAILHDIYGDGPGARVPYQQHTCAGPVGPVIERCTATNPNKRFKSVAALRSALLTVLSSPRALNASPTATDWVEKLENLPNWDASTAFAFNRFMAREATSDDQTAVCLALDEERLASIHEIDPDLWHTVAFVYCEWAQGSFDFSYCDVVAARLERIFALGSLECKAAVVLATAKLGESHNRWFVMECLFRMCGSVVGDRLAERIAIEIIAEEAQDNFSRCAEGIGLTIDDYHPRIAQVLRQEGRRVPV